MYNNSYQALPKSYGYGGNYGPHSKRGSSGGVVTTVAFVVLVLACGGLSLAFMSARSHLHDMAIHHEALQEELTFNKNHLHHVEAQLASRELDYQHLSSELHSHVGGSTQELESLRQQKRTSDQALTTANEELARVKQDLDATNALVEAYKQHLSDEVASHHQREENWLHIQEDWERLEKEMEAEVNSLRQQLQAAKLQIPAGVKEHHTMPQHVNPEAARPHDPIYDNLPPAHIPAHQQQQQQQQRQQQPVATPVPVPVQQQQQVPVPVQQQQQQQVPQPAAAPAQQQQQQAGQPQQQQQQQQHNQQQPGHAQQQQQPPMPAPPAPAANLHHNPHYDFHLETHDHETHDWQPDFFDHNNHYADYPGWVDEPQHEQQHHDAHQQQQQHHDAHHQQQQQQHAGHHEQQHGGNVHHEWHHQDDSHHFHQQDPHQHQDPHQQQQHGQANQQQQQQQQQHHDGHWDHTAGHGQEVYQAHHDDWHAAPAGHVHDDLSMKLGLGGGHAAHHQDPHQQQWHH
ncbi:hypothetical protein OEZ85_003421 [Tetradesmus obliquus]|uniref:Uncharacterized protein n=1 Tax=Tetradesmus obliquus TaxID=3088 RepID=A0ABY8UDJ4_TETOB|nr:hypothetical protein OEZ85_003421 [Tetradesmus obliquus]